MYIMRSEMDAEMDMVFNKSGGKIQSGGFNVESFLMGTPNLQTGGGVLELFKNLAVPAGLAHLPRHQNAGTSGYYKNNDDVIRDDIHERMLKMVEVAPNLRQRKTRRHNIGSSGKNKTKSIR